MADDVIVISCVWCSEPGFSNSHVKEFVGTDRYDCDNPTWYQEAYDDLCSCFDCVEEFHRSLDSLVASSSSGDTTGLKKLIYLNNVARLSDRLRELLQSMSNKTYPKVKVEEENYGPNIDCRCLETPLLEVLSHPRLLLDNSLCDLFVEALELMNSVDQPLEVTKKKLPGVYLLLVHPCDEVRHWAVDVIRNLELVNWEEYDDLEEVVHWLVNVFSDPQSEIGSAAWDDRLVVHLPSHLYSPVSKKTFWLGLCMLVKSLDTDSIRSRFMSSSSGHPKLAGNILQSLCRHDNQSFFMPLLKCFSLLLERLGSRFWQFANTAEPKSVCETIFSHHAFIKSVKEMKKKTRHGDTCVDLSSYSQLVYHWNSQSKTGDHHEQELDDVLFCWIVPFMLSLLDFSIENIVHQLFCSVNKILLSCENKGDNSLLHYELISTLTGMVRTLYTKQAYSDLLSCQKFWLQPLIKAINGSSSTQVVQLFQLLLSSTRAKQVSQTKMFISHLKSPSSSLSQKSVASSLLNHVLEVLKVLTRSHPSGSSDVQTEECELFCPNRIEESTPFQTGSSKINTPKRLLTIKTEEGHTPLACNTYPTAGKSGTYEPQYKHDKKPSMSGASTDELEEWECGPPSLRETSLPSKKKDRKRLSLNHQSNRVVYEEKAHPKTNLQTQPKQLKLSVPKLESTTCVSSPGIFTSVRSSASKDRASRKSPSILTSGKSSMKSPKLCNSSKSKVISHDMETPPLSSDSSSDSELPSFKTLMSTPTKVPKQIKGTSDKTVTKVAAAKEEDKSGYVCNKDANGTLSNRLMSVKEKGATLIGERDERLREHTVQNDYHKECDSSDKFNISSEEEFIPVKENMSAGAPKLNLDKDAVQHNTEESLTSKKLLSDNDNIIVDEFSDNEAEEKKLLSSPTSMPILHEDKLADDNVGNNSLYPDSQSVSSFVFCDLAESNEESEDDETFETVLAAFEAQNETKRSSSRSGNSAIKSPSPEVECANETEMADLTEDDELQRITDEQNLGETHYMAEENVYSDISSDEFCSQITVRRSPSIVNASNDASISSSSNPSIKTPKYISSVSVDIVPLSIKELKKLTTRSKSTENTQRKRKRELELRANHQSPQLPAEQQTSKRPKLLSFLVEQIPPIACQKTPTAPQVVKPVGMVFSSKKSILQKAFGESVSHAETAQTTSSCSKQRVVTEPKNTRALLKETSRDHRHHSGHPEQLVKKALHPQQLTSCTPPTTARKLSRPVEKIQPPSTSSLPSFSGPKSTLPGHSAVLPPQNRHSSLSSSSSPVGLNFANKLTSSTADLMRTVPTTSPSKGKPPSSSIHPLNPTISTRPKNLKTINHLYAAILSWDPNVFLYPEQDERGVKRCPYCPEDLVRNACRVPLTFLSYDQYYDVFSPLFFMELWETIFQEIHNTTSKPPPCTCTVETSSHTHYFQNIRVKITMSSKEAKMYAHPTERDLVVVTQQGNKCFGLVEQQKHIFLSSAEGRGKCEVLMDVKLLGQFGFMEKSRVELSVVTSMTNEIRQWIGLINFHTSLLIRDLLYPRGREYFCHSSVSQPDLKSSNRYNPRQSECIAAAASAMCAQYAQPRILLLQGPPGTGKTHTISGIIQEGFKELHKKSIASCPSSLPGSRGAGRKRPHILVCAPSNAAVDEIIRKMINDGIVCDPSKISDMSGHGSLKVVRIGNREKIHPQNLPYSLDHLAQNKIKSASEQELVTSRNMNTIRQQISAVEKRVEEARRNYYIYSTVEKKQPDKKIDLHGLQAHIRALEVEKSELTKQHKMLRSQCTNNKRDQAMVRKRILQDADVVCATLCGSGSSALYECIKNVLQHFDCVIVDEASQCTELDVLVPLRYHASKLILVGDPLQLPATVRSRQAEEYGYDQSLFERLYKFFTTNVKSGGTPIKMLNVQYRMLPEICYFPSKHFYSDELQTDYSVSTSVKNLNCFLVFNILKGKEEKVGGSIRNTDECTFLLSLLKSLRSHKSIGVITPYKAQEKRIKYLIQKELADVVKVEVGTVDGFQGREKDIVVLSCVRANGRDGSIGFLCDRKRLNVALTRAKKALYVLGHCDTLQVNEDWAALIEHANNCSAIVNVETDLNRAVSHIWKNCKSSTPPKYVRSKINTIGQKHISSAPINKPAQVEPAVTSTADPCPQQSAASVLRQVTFPTQPHEKQRRATIDCSTRNSTTVDSNPVLRDPRLIPQNIHSNTASNSRRLSLDIAPMVEPVAQKISLTSSSVMNKGLKCTPGLFPKQRRVSATEQRSSDSKLPISTQGSERSIPSMGHHHSQAANIVAPRALGHKVPFLPSIPSTSTPSTSDVAHSPVLSVPSMRVARTPHHHVSTEEKLLRVTRGLVKDGHYRKMRPGNIRERLSKYTGST